MIAHVEIRGIEVFAFIGVDAQEKKVGNRYRIDIEYDYDATEAAQRDGVNAAVSYAEVINIATEEARGRRADLLEHVVEEIATKIRAACPKILGGRVSITKMRPPIAGCTAAVTITAAL